MAMPSMPMLQFSWRHLNLWHLGALPLILLIGAAMLYWGATLRAAYWPRWCSVMFLCGLLVTFIATESVIGYFDMEYFSDHMVQHLLLIMVAAPLFALSRPLDLAYEVGPAALRSFL